MPTRPAVALAIIIGTSSGLTRVGPFSPYSAICSSSVRRPPMPVPATHADPAGIDAGAGEPAVAEGRAHGVAGGGDAELGGAVECGGPP